MFTVMSMLWPLWHIAGHIEEEGLFHATKMSLKEKRKQFLAQESFTLLGEKSEKPVQPKEKLSLRLRMYGAKYLMP